jgi:hypothetical protein
MKHSLNFFRLNYNHGRTHSGMIAYLVELWNTGKQQPLDAFLAALDVRLPPCKSLVPQLEYHNIDLAIKNEKEKVVLLLEMKVDDFQTWKKLSKKDLIGWKDVGDKERCFSHHPTGKNPYLIQTEMYTFREGIHAMEPEDRPACLFVTLGTGEFKEEFNSLDNIWKDCGLRKFVEAVESVHLPEDQLFQQWKAALQKELALRRSCWEVSEEADSEIDSGDRTGLLPMMRLGSLRRMLIDEYEIRTLGFEPSIYKVGVGPDTILNFLIPDDQREEGFRFCEINNNGMLNFKMMFYAKASIEEKQAQVAAFNEELGMAIESNYQPNVSGKYGKTKTVGRVDVGLEAHLLLPAASLTSNDISLHIAKYLKVIRPYLETEVKMA